MKKVEMKRCTSCNAVKPITEFPYKSKAHGVLYDICRDCHDKKVAIVRARQINSKNENKYNNLEMVNEKEDEFEDIEVEVEV